MRRICVSFVLFKVSIHATLAGGDNRQYFWRGFCGCVLSTPPSRVATPCSHFITFSAPMFLSTPPFAGGDVLLLCHGFQQHVSIHATLAGGDLGNGISFANKNTFLSTPPSRVATLVAQIHHDMLVVSIHATLAGGDVRITLFSNSGAMFYPRHPRGWRPLMSHLPSMKITCFYPRHPRGWRPVAGRTSNPCIAEFLSTPPSRVATCYIWYSTRKTFCFYPRHPRGWRQRELLENLPSSMFLSTPPLAGGDRSGRAAGGAVPGCFYPRHPSRVATANPRECTKMYSVFFAQKGKKKLSVKSKII